MISEQNYDVFKAYLTIKIFKFYQNKEILSLLKKTK